MKFQLIIIFISTLLFGVKSLDESTLSNYDKIKLTYLNGIFEPDFQEKIVKGDLIYKFESIDDGDEIILDTKFLNIISITDDKTKDKIKWDFGEEDENLGKPLKIHYPFETGQNIYLNIIYTTTIDGNSCQFLNKEQTRSKKYEYFFTMSEMIVGRELLPSQDTPSIKFSFDLGIKVPKEIRGLISGLFDHVVEEENTKIYYYRQDIPIPNYLIALAAGEIDYKNISNNISVYADPGYIDEVVNELKDMPTILQLAEKYMGPYEWGKYNVLVLPPSFPYSGMENPCLSFCSPCLINGDGSLVDIVAHELIHSWSGNLVTNGNWSDFWLNEGITMFLQRKIVGQWKNDTDYAKMDGILGLFYIEEYLDYFEDGSTHTTLRPNLTGVNPDDFYSDIPYEKGYNFIYYIESLIGEELMENFFKEYFQHFKYSSIFLEDFIDYLYGFCRNNSISEDILNEIKWEDWIYEPGPCFIENNLTNKYSIEVDKYYNGFINGILDRELKEKISNWSHTSKTVFMNKLEQREQFLTDEQHDFITNELNFLEGQDFLVQTNYYRLILARTDKFLEREEEGLINYLSSYGALDYMAGLYELFYKRDEEKAVQTLDDLRGFYHNLMIYNAEDEFENAKNNFPIIELDLNNQCIFLTENSSLDIIINNYEDINMADQNITILNGVLLESEKGKVDLECYLNSEKNYCLIQSKIQNSGPYYLNVPERIQNLDYAIKKFKGKNTIKIKAYEQDIQINETKMNESEYEIDYKYNNSKIQIYFLNEIDDSVTVKIEDKEVECNVFTSTCLECEIDKNIFPYNKSKPKTGKKYNLKILDLCGEEIYNFDISVKKTDEEEPKDDDDDGIGTGLIVLIILASLIVVIGIVFLICRAKRKNSKVEDVNAIEDRKLLSDI